MSSSMAHTGTISREAKENREERVLLVRVLRKVLEIIMTDH